MDTRSENPFELINVHRVSGVPEIVQYLKNADHEVVEGLFYNAKHHGMVSFVYNGQRYDMIRNRDFSFTVALSADQELTPESFS